MYFCNHIKIHVAFELVSYAPAHFFDPSVLRIIGGLVLPFAQSALEGKGEDGRVIILEFTSMCTYRSQGCDYISAFTLNHLQGSTQLSAPCALGRVSAVTQKLVRRGRVIWLPRVSEPSVLGTAHQ